MRDTQRVREYFSQVMNLVNQMRALGDRDTTYQKLVEKLLISLPESFDSIVTTIEETKNLEALPIQQLISSLEAHEEIKLQRNMANETAFKATTDSKHGNYPKRENLEKPAT
jgi:ribosome-binding protein aMBF1 (putative translation factor)